MTPKPVDASFRRHGLWALTGRLANFAIVACSAFIFARLMPSKADFGTFTYLQSIVALLGIVGGVGSGTVAIRWISEARHEEGSVAEPLLKIAKTLAVTATVIGIATGVGLAAWPTSGSFSAGGSLAFVLIGCAVALRSTHQFVGGAARAESRLKTANLLDGANGGAISNGLLLLGVIATSCFVSVTWQRAVVSMAIANLVTALVGIWLLRDLFRTDAIDDEPSATTVSSPSMLSVGVPVAAASLLVFLVEQLDLLFAGWTLSEDSLADYSAAKRVSLV
ncbi:MAG: oligosaccharide flippase family protein, partial [Planctomycetota bacterium]